MQTLSTIVIHPCGQASPDLLDLTSLILEDEELVALAVVPQLVGMDAGELGATREDVSALEDAVDHA